MLNDFKQFVLRGNVVDLAVGVMIGGAFGKIVSSLVEDVLMPPIGLLMGGMNFANLTLTLRPAVLDAQGNTLTDPVLIFYGQFLQTSLDFLMMAFCIFMLVKGIESLRGQKEAPAIVPPPPPQEEILLTEIRDLLKTR